MLRLADNNNKRAHAILLLLQSLGAGFRVATGAATRTGARRPAGKRRSLAKAPAVSSPLRWTGSGFWDKLALAFVVLGGFVWAMTVLQEDKLLSDEGFHWIQVAGFIHGDFAAHNITVIPGYHLAVAYIMKAFSLDTVTAARYVSSVLALPAVVFFYRIVSGSGEGNAAALTQQLFLCPIIFPFFFLVYTDMISLCLLLLALWLTLDGRYRSAAAVAGISILFRQANVVWLFLFWLLALNDNGFFRPLSTVRSLAAVRSLKLRDFADPLRRTYMYGMFCLLFAAFVLANRGVALGDAGMHSLRMPHVTQLFLLLFMVFVLFLPLHIRNAPAILALLKSRPLLLFSSMLLYAVYIATFDASHNYNQIDFFLRNRLIIWLHESFLNRSLAFIPMLWAFWSLAVTPLRERKYYWLYPVTALFLLPIGLVEQRYYMVPVVLFMLFRKPMDDRLEYLAAAAYIPFTMFLFMGMAVHDFFL